MIGFIPGYLLSLFTFPGVIMHEISHRLMCDVFKVPVYHVRYFIPFSQQAGVVYHERIHNIKHHLCVAAAPLVINTILCMIFTLPMGASQYIIGYSSSDIGISISNYEAFYYFLWWIGISMGANAFPSNHDMEAVLAAAPDSYGIGMFTSMIQIANFLRIIWISFFYAYGISLILPALIFG
jgi:hypothetical protein